MQALSNPAVPLALRTQVADCALAMVNARVAARVARRGGKTDAEVHALYNVYEEAKEALETLMTDMADAIHPLPR